MNFQEPEPDVAKLCNFAGSDSLPFFLPIRFCVFFCLGVGSFWRSYFPATVMYTFGFGLSSVHALRVQQSYTSLINKLHVVLALLTPPGRQTQ